MSHGVNADPLFTDASRNYSLGFRFSNSIFLSCPRRRHLHRPYLRLYRHESHLWCSRHRRIRIPAAIHLRIQQIPTTGTVRLYSNGQYRYDSPLPPLPPLLISPSLLSVASIPPVPSNTWTSPSTPGPHRDKNWTASSTVPLIHHPRHQHGLYHRRPHTERRIHRHRLRHRCHTPRHRSQRAPPAIPTVPIKSAYRMAPGRFPSCMMAAIPTTPSISKSTPPAPLVPSPMPQALQRTTPTPTLNLTIADAGIGTTGAQNATQL